MNFLLDFVKGLVIGIGGIAPGVSGGTLAVIFGIYEKITDAIANIWVDFKGKVKYFLPIGLGAAVGFLGFSRIMSFLFQNNEIEVKYLFIGLMAGSLPSVFRQANSKGFKKRFLIPLVLTLSLTILLTILENQAVNIVPEGSEPGFMLLAVCGAILGFGTMAPGVSASFILMYLGTYQTLLDGIANIRLPVLVPAGIGFAVSIILFAKLINYLFKKAYGYTYYAVLGFALGSIYSIYPGFAFTSRYIICIILFAAGLTLSLWLSKFEKI